LGQFRERDNRDKAMRQRGAKSIGDSYSLFEKEKRSADEHKIRHLSKKGRGYGEKN